MATDKDIRYSVTAEDRFSRTFGNLKRDITGASDQIGKLGGIAGIASRAVAALSLGTVAGVGGLALALKSLSADLDALNETSAAVGSTVENLSALEDVARRNGATLDLVTNALLKLNMGLADPNPNSRASQALKDIGLSAEELRRQDPALALQKIAVALAGYENSGAKARITQDLFGKSTREVAKYLQDIASAGELNATVTAEQAAQARAFNDNLATLQTQISNTARELAGPLLSGFNDVFSAVNNFGPGKLNNYLAIPLQTIGVLAANVGFVFNGVGRDIGGVAAQLAALGRGDFQGFKAIGQALRDDAKAAREEFDKLERKLLQIGTIPTADYSNEGRSRTSSLKSLTATENARTTAATAQVSAAERYLETLQRQADKLDELTTVQQLLRDIEQGRLDGLTPKLRTRLLLEASQIDALKAQTAEMKLQQAALDDLVDATSRRADELDRILAATPTARAQVIERQVDIVLKYARANPEDEAVQRQALEAVKQLREQFDQLAEAPKPVAAEVDKLRVTIDRFAENSIDALTSLVVDGGGSFDRLFDSFKRDVLRELIEDPMRESMRQVVKIIKDELTKLDSGGGVLGSLTKLFESLGSSSGSGGGFDWGRLFSSIFGGASTSRANGGPVRAGQLVRWQEGGREYFVPGQDGTVVNQGQMQAAGGAGGYQENHFHINGSDPAMMRRELQAALDERDARMMRSLRNGRARSLVGA